MRKGAVFIGKVILLLLSYIGVAKYVSICTYGEADEAYLKKNRESTKFRSYYNTLVSWMELLQNKDTIARYFSKDDSVAVYGMGKIGELICKELLENGINVSYGIDENNSGESMTTGLHVYSAEKKDLPEVDYIIISITYLSDSIIPELEKVSSAKIITIDEIEEKLWGDKK